jgi:hypothetical protein
MANAPDSPDATGATGPLVTAIPDTSPPDGAAPAEPSPRDNGSSGVSLTPGARPLPEYELVRQLGRGGFGEVWLATGPGGFDVALKFIRLGVPAAQVELRSLELVKGIRHPHLLTTFGAWHEGDYLIIAMEVAQRTLQQRWQECSAQGMPGIPAGELLEYVRQAAEGLDYLNEGRHLPPGGGAGSLQHKDVKPQNLLIVGGAVKVADFGLVQLLEQTSVSATGGLTPAYAAPEFFQGRATRWSDQYSLAVTYCHLRSGRLPFTGSAARLMAGHVSQPPDLDMLPEAERAVVERALAKEPTRRWPSCRAFAEALSATAKLAGQQITTTPGVRVVLPTWRPVDKVSAAQDELRQALAVTDPSALLVPLRALRRLLRAEFGGPYLLVPHENCYAFDRDMIFRHVEPDELGLEPDQLLPSTVILLARPSTEQLEGWGREGALLRYWRLLFHARVHVTLHRRHEEGLLTPADILARIEQIGATEFGEVRTVLRQENVLPRGADDLAVYIEFAASYLEMRYFRSNLLATFFPAFHDLQRIDNVLAQDVDAAALFASTRLPGAPEPVVRTDTSSDESHSYYWKLVRHAERAALEGDLVRAAIERTRAARVAPPALGQDTRAAAFRNLKDLTLCLQGALPQKLSVVSCPLPAGGSSPLTTENSQLATEEWLQVLPALLDKADQGRWPVEAKLLYDLQKLCHEHGQKLYSLDLVEWALWMGKRPLKRPLSLLQLVRATNHLRLAAGRLTLVRVSDEDRQHLTRLLQGALHASEERLRERVRPILRDAFHDVGLVARDAPGQVAVDKMIDELLDRVTENSFFTFSDLRDTIAANQLKLADLADPHEFWQGDPLLRLDRRLASAMEGVYRPGEFYLRWLESGSSLLFGTSLGRFLARNVLAPFGGAFLLLTALLILWNHATGIDVSIPPPPWSFLLLGAGLFAVLHVESVRGWLADMGRRIFRGLRSVFYETPRRLWQQPWVRRALRSWPFLLLLWYVVEPLAVYGLLYWRWPEPFGSLTAALLTILAVNLFLHSRIGVGIVEAAKEGLLLLAGWVRVDGIRGLVRVISEFFKRLTDAFESLLYTVDEWLRFRSDETRLSLTVRAVLGVLWFPFRYVFRLYFLVLIEPSLNPLKLPLAILATKFFYMIPGYLGLVVLGSEAQAELIDQLIPSLGRVPALLLFYVGIYPTLWLLPSAVAFLVWELRGNWRLFRANRPVQLRPEVVGHHGEGVLQLLKPGAHSGTVPRLFGRLRQAERAAYRTGDWRAARACRQELREVARSVQVFVEREFVALLHRSRCWPEPQPQAPRPFRVAQVVLSCARIRIELGHADFPEESAWIALEEQSGWLVAGVQEAGWIRHLTVAQRRALASALAGLYCLAGVHFVREQLAAVLPASLPGYHLTDQQLVVWTGEASGQAVAYRLRSRRQELSPRGLNGIPSASAPRLDTRKLFFSRLPLTWERWVECWRQDQEQGNHPQVFGEEMQLLPAFSALRQSEQHQPD